MDKKQANRNDTIKNNTLNNQTLFIQAYKQNLCNVSKACEAININRDTYYQWKQKYPTFKKECEDAEEGLIDLAESALKTNIELGNPASIFFFLCNRKPERWQNIQKIQHAGDISAPLQFTINHVKSNGNNGIPQNGNGNGKQH